MARPVPSFDVARAAELYAEGASIYQVGARLGVAPSSVSRLLRKAGVVMRPSVARPSAVESAEVVRLRDVEGWTWRQVADEVGMTVSGVRSRYRHTVR